MSGNRSDSSNVPVSQASVPVAPSPVPPAAADSMIRWAALDSRHERLVTASDSLLAELGRKGTAEKLLAS
jgi:hypothetical protein